MRTYFFDTEFTGLRKDTTLISIGIVSDTHSCGLECVRHTDNSRNSGRGRLQAYVQYEWCGYFREENRD